MITQVCDCIFSLFSIIGDCSSCYILNINITGKLQSLSNNNIYVYTLMSIGAACLGGEDIALIMTTTATINGRILSE